LGVYLLVSKKQVPPLSQRIKEEQLDQEPQGESTITLRDFHRIESQSGKLKWEVKATRGEYFPERNMAELIKPEIVLRDQSGTPINVTAPLGKVIFKGEEGLEEAELFDGVVLTRADGTTIRTAKITYRAKTSQIYARQHTEITGSNFIVVGDQLTYNTKTQLAQLSGNTSSNFSNSSE
jgi:LPS export ABC transporter protein LptC